MEDDVFSVFAKKFSEKHKLCATARMVVNTLAHAARMSPDHPVTWERLNYGKPFTNMHGGVSGGGAMVLRFYNDDPMAASFPYPIERLMTRDQAMELFHGYYGLIGKPCPEIEPRRTLADTAPNLPPAPVPQPTAADGATPPIER